MQPDGGGLPLGWPTIYRAGPGYLLGVPQMLPPEPKNHAGLGGWIEVCFDVFLVGDSDDSRMMALTDLWFRGQHQHFFGAPCATR